MIRKATEKDINWIYSLANDTREYSLNKDPIKLEDHKAWFEKNKDKILVIGQNYGTIRKDGNFISIALKEKYRNLGIGTKVLKTGSGRAICLLSNPRSIHVFVKAGFRIKGVYLEKWEK